MELELSCIGCEAEDAAVNVNGLSVIIPAGCSKKKIMEIL
jgi:hypothetical protein